MILIRNLFASAEQYVYRNKRLAALALQRRVNVHWAP